MESDAGPVIGVLEALLERHSGGGKPRWKGCEGQQGRRCPDPQARLRGVVVRLRGGVRGDDDQDSARPPVVMLPRVRRRVSFAFSASLDDGLVSMGNAWADVRMCGVISFTRMKRILTRTIETTLTRINKWIIMATSRQCVSS